MKTFVATPANRERNWVVVDANGKEHKLKTWKFTAGTRHLSWLAPAKLAKKPFTPRNGTDLQAILGTWMTWNFKPLDVSVAEFQGPVIQNADCPLRNAFCAAEPSTLELIRPSLFHLSIRWAFLRKVGFATPMSEGSRLPARFVPNHATSTRPAVPAATVG